MSDSAFYVDASVIAGLLLGDIDIDPIRSAVGDDARLIYSEFGFGEVVSAISARIRAVNASDADAADRISELRSYLTGWDRTGWHAGDLDRAITLTAQASLALKLPDAIHCATAERVGLPLLTTDRQQHRAAQIIGLRSTLPQIRK